MKSSLAKNILAAVGAVVLVVLAIFIFLAGLFGGDGIAPGDKVAVVRIAGVITDPSEVNRELRKYGERGDVKAVVVRIESPGGAVGPSQEIHREIRRLAGDKPVVASLGTVAASGGYYAAVGADRIVANPGTITGSIGVIIEFINAEGLLDKVGLKGYVVKSGRYKDTGSPIREMTPDERALLQGVIDDVNSQFIAAVAEGRGMTTDDVARVADGRILTGSQALERGLVDTLGGLSDAVDLGAELAGIEEPQVIYPPKKDFGLLELVFGDSGGAGSLAGIFSDFRIMYLARVPGL